MTFAGLWDEWKDRASGEKLKSCTMIVTEPNSVAADIHDRVPVILERTDFGSWLNDGGTELLMPAVNNVLQRWPVSKPVNSSRACRPAQALFRGTWRSLSSCFQRQRSWPSLSADRS
jgi:putative SOS response-associated peptidase YedK